MKGSLIKTAAGIAALTLWSAAAQAVVVQTFGSGSAVSVVQGSANFDPQSSLFDNPYDEGGMVFERIGLSFDNNGCGYDGCQPLFNDQGFSGNYMYGVGTGGYFEISAGGGNEFVGLEFVSGTGYFSLLNFFRWEAYDDAVLVGSGDLFLNGGGILGFSDLTGFDMLRITTSDNSGVDFLSSFNAPAFDSVRAQFTGQVPEPMSLSLLGLGLAGLAGLRRFKA